MQRSDDQVTGILEKGRLITLNRVAQKLEAPADRTENDQLLPGHNSPRKPGEQRKDDACGNGRYSDEVRQSV